MREFRMLAVNGQLGYGFRGSVQGGNAPQARSGRRGRRLKRRRALLSGHGKSHCDDSAIKRDLRIVLPTVLKEKIPFIIGSASTAGETPISKGR
jgi:hypothetical protein